MDSDNNIRAITPRPSAPSALPPHYPDRPDTMAASPHLRVPSLWDHWFILLRHRWTVLTATVVALILGAMVTFATTPIYEAIGRIVINREGEDTANLKSANNGGDSDYDYMVMMDTQTRILQSDAIAKLVIRKLNLDSNPAFARQDAKIAVPAADTGTGDIRYIEPHREAALVAKFHGTLQIDSIPRTRLLEIRFTSPDPNLAPQVVNSLIDTYIEQNFKMHLDASTRTSAWLSQQLSELELKVEESQEKLVRYEKEHSILGIDDKQNIITSKLDELNKELTAAEADRMQRESKYEMAKSGDPGLLASSNLDESSPLVRLRTQESDLHRQLAQLSVRFDSSYPAVQELNSQIASVQADIRAETARMAKKYQQEYREALSHEKLLRTALENQKGQANDLNESAIEYSSLKRDVESGRQLYEGLLEKSKEAGVMTGLRSSNIRIVDPASLPTSPVKPSLPHNLMIAMLVGLVGGMSLAFIIESLDNGVHSIEQIQMITTLPLLAVIPSEPPLNSSRFTRHPSRAWVSEGVTTMARPHSEIAEAYRALRTAILLSRDAKLAKVLMVTSALPQEGKTTTSVNLAAVLAQQGSRVLLIEGDMRRAGVCLKLNLQAEVGLSAVLTESTLVDTVILRVPGILNLWVLPAGPTTLYPSEILGSTHMKELLYDLRREFDHVIIDTPPVLTVTDAVMLSALVDATLLVARAGTTSKAALRRVREVLDQVDARIIGVVLNAMDLTQFGSEYYGGYRDSGYYYHSGSAASSE
jgi:capsular exopolysaccharide synthesis family protein